jgi:hypothetical protein
MATRLVRAKKRIKAVGIPLCVPDRADLPARMASRSLRLSTSRIPGDHGNCCERGNDDLE